MYVTRYSIYVPLLIATFHRILAVGTKCPKPEIISPCRCVMKREERQVWCSHSDLPSVLSGLRSLSKHLSAPIDELILENNYLPSLPGRTFANLKVLRIMLRQNGLERVSPDWLHDLENILLELFIVEPKLRYLPDESLGRMNALEAITIQTNDLKRLPEISSLAMLRYIQVESVALNELSSRNFKKLPVLEKIHISGSKNLRKLDAGLFENMPLMKSINVSNCGIFWIHPRTFSNLPGLKMLSLTNNDIREAGMVGRACKDLNSLKELILDHNKIDKLPTGSFVDLPSLQNLHISSNKITEIQQGAFHRVPSLRVLHLNNNMLRKIHPECFIHEFNGGLEELWMTHNHISHISELRSVLNALPRLIYLDMSFNELEKIPFGSLRGHPTLEVMKLNSNRIRQIDKESFMAMPALRELSLKNNSLTNYHQEPLWNLPSLKGLDLSQNKLRKLEPHFLANLPSLRKLDMSDNEMIFIDPIALSLIPFVEFVNLSQNNLKFIHSATFKHLEKLYELDVSRNQLEEFLVEIPEGLEYLHLRYNKLRVLPFLSGSAKFYFLKYLDISYNSIENMNTFNLQNFASLKILSITNNFIQRLEADALVGLSKLEILDLSFNKIVGIHPRSFENINNLVELNLRNNFLESIFTGLIHKIPKLTKLDVSKNKLVDFMQGNLKFNPTIKYLNMSHNFLIDMPKHIFKMRYMTVLDMSYNRIKNLPVEAFSKLEYLVDLRISNNFIKELRLSTFSKLKTLRVLHLDHNDLHKIETNTFQSLPSLEMIKLDHNKLSTISSYTFNNLTMLQVAELQSNNLQNLASDAFNLVPNIVFLNLSQNNIQSIEESGLRNIPSVEVLDLSNNMIRRIETDSFKRMEWLVEIKLEDNQICAISGTPFSYMPRLRVISLRKNELRRVPENVLERIRTNIAVFDVDENPLICDCNILWLQMWVEESSIMGPHCSNGHLVREIKLAPSYCKQNFMKNVYADCDEITNHFSQTFTKFPNLRNVSSEEKTNILAPLPQESEYFYDEYVDYPFNESLSMISKDQEGILDRFLKVNHSSVMVPEVSSHLISGDTPTLYAAPSKNKTKPDIPKEVPHSPSSSGFTFFGVPLPSINLSQLIGGNNKKSSPKSDQKYSVPVADRKIAIVNVPVFRSTTARNIFKQPPSTPLIETGGFRPMLPGEGGFMPILEFTTIMSDSPKTESSTALIESTQNMVSVSETQETNQEAIVDSSNSASSASSAIIRTTPQVDLEASITDVPEGTTLSPAENSTQNSNSPYLTVIVVTELNPISEEPPKMYPHEFTTKNNSMENTTTVPERLVTANTTELLDNKNNHNNSIPVTEDMATTEGSTDKEKENVRLVTEGASLVKGNDDLNMKNSDLDKHINITVHIEKINSSTTEVSRVVAMKKGHNESTDGWDTVAIKTKNRVQNVERIAKIVNATRRPDLMVPTPTLLIPGGHQPHMRSVARSTITKVQSPFTTEGSISIEMPKERNPKKSGEAVTLDPEITKVDELKESWYFANYNKTYSEPYHGINPNCVRGIGVSGYTLIFSVLGVLLAGY